MALPSGQSKLKLGSIFWIRWVLGNSLAYALGLGLPIMLADLLSIQNYATWVVSAFLSLGLWVGLTQWLILRQFLPISGQWVTVSVLSPLLSMSLIISFVLKSPPLFFLMPIIYSLLAGLGQWRILRRLVQPSWSWIITNIIGVVLGGSVGWIFGTVSSTWMNQPGISTLIGGFCCGFFYSLVTGISLHQLIRQRHKSPTTVEYSSFDTPPGHKYWRYQVISGTVFFVLLWVWISIFPVPLFSSGGSANSLPLWLRGIYPVICTFVYVYVSVLVHELGHLLFALSNRFELRVFAVGQWVLVRRDKGLKFFRIRHRFAGGFVSPVSKSLHSLNRRVFMMLLGGPVASFLLFLVGALPLLSQSLVSQYEIIRFPIFLSVYSLYSAIFNILPVRMGYSVSDGRRMLDLAQNNLQGQRYTAFYAMDANLRQGVRPRDIVPDLIDRALAIPEKSGDHISGLLMAYQVELDKGRFDQAGHYLDQALDIHLYYPKIFRGLLLLEGAYFEAHIRHRVDLAREWFEKIQDKAFIEPYKLLRAEAALLLAEGDKEAALLKAKQGIASAGRDRFMIGDAIAESERLQELIQEMI